MLHWSAGRYRTYFPHYQFCILGPRDDQTGDGEVVSTFPVEKNLRRIPSGDLDYAAHTRGRNSGRIGISAMAMYQATTNTYGVFPPTPRQIESLCAVAGLVVAKYGKGLPIDAQVKTHYEWAVIDAYFPNRWDWMKEGPLLKRKVEWYAARAR